MTVSDSSHHQSTIREQEMIEPSELKNRFHYHPPQTKLRGQVHEGIRNLCMATAEQLNNLLPDGYEKTMVMAKLEEAMFWANAAIARTPDESKGRR